MDSIFWADNHYNNSIQVYLYTLDNKKKKNTLMFRVKIIRMSALFALALHCGHFSPRPFNHFSIHLKVKKEEIFKKAHPVVMRI